MQYFPGAIVILVHAGIFFGMFRKVLSIFGLIDHGNRGVMHHTAIAGKHFACLDPLVLREIRGNVNVFVIVQGSFGHEKFGDGENDVRLHVPARFEDGGRRHVLLVALFHSSFDPFIDGGDIRVAQARIVHEFTDTGIRMPWRHLALIHALPNQAGERQNLFMGQERHGSNVVWTMAHDAILVQDGRNIFAIGDFFLGRRALLSGFKQQTARTGHANNGDHDPQTHLAPLIKARYLF